MRILALLLCLTAAAGRVEVNFDFSWRVETEGTTQATDMKKKDVSYDDGSWEVVDAPHDFLIDGGYNTSAPAKQGNIPRKNAWYRKHFSVPQDFSGKHIFIYFEGIFKLATVYLNGVEVRYHETGYTSFQARLDNCSALEYGPSKTNVLAIYVDGTIGSGWWYEGAGIYRHVKLIATSKQYFELDGISAPTHSMTVDSKGVSAQNPILNTTFAIGNLDVASSAGFSLNLNLVDQKGVSIATSDVKVPTLAGNSTTNVKYDFNINETISLWSILNPSLYTLKSKLMSNSVVVDEQDVTIGFRSILYTADQGFFLNKQHVKVRGFCDHNNFASVGMAVPDRVKLFAAQTLRSIGGNGRRMSHNPPEPVMLDLYDRLGVVVMDENRDFQGNNTADVRNMGAMVKRDRNHPAITIWSYCNEVGCNSPDGTGAPYRNITYAYDGTRPTLGNDYKNQNLNTYMDVQGFSHKTQQIFLDYHKQYPSKPTFASECCSCKTMRGEDFTNASTNVPFADFNADCTSEQVGASDSLDFMSGTMVWTLFDYYGEAQWPLVTSAYGQLDIAGFWKAAAHWYQTWWRADISSSAYDKAPLTDIPFTCHIVEHFNPPTKRTIHVYTNGPNVTLDIDGKLFGEAGVPYRKYAQFHYVPWEGGCVTATVMKSGKAVATCKRCAVESTDLKKIELSLDAPSVSTGTGSTLYADGQDVALVRATLVDGSGNVGTAAANPLTFSVVSGPGRVIGTHNGDQRNHIPSNSSSTIAFHGLARCLIQVTEDFSGSVADRQLLSSVTVDKSPRTHIVIDAKAVPQDIVIRVVSPGLVDGLITIPVSANSDSSVLATAANSTRF